jgi:hypothetical protein
MNYNISTNFIDSLFIESIAIYNLSMLQDE